MPVSCCGTVHHGSSPRRIVHKKPGIRTCLSQPCSSVGLSMLRTEGAEERDEEQEDEGEDLRDGGIPFIINRGGLPVNEETWEQMWRHVARIHPDGEAVARRIRGTGDLPKVQPSHRETCQNTQRMFSRWAFPSLKNKYKHTSVLYLQCSVFTH